MTDSHALGRVSLTRVVVLDGANAREPAGFIVECAEPERLAFDGSGGFDYVCSTCRAVICRGVKPGLFAGLVFRCRCGALSRVRESTKRLSPFE